MNSRGDFVKRLLTVLCLLTLILVVASCAGFAEVDENQITEIPEEEIEPQSIEERKEVTISMVGDIIFYGSVESYMKKYGDHYLLESYGPLMKKSDIVLGNLETSISKRGVPVEDKQYTFRGKPEALKTLKNNNFTAVSIANNHVLDYGVEAFLDTLNYLEKYELLYAGGGRNKEEALKGILIEKNGIKVGFLAFTKVVPLVEWYAGKNKPGIIGAYMVHEKEFVKAIKDMKQNCDVLVVSVHWGKESSTVIREEEQYIGRRMIDAGADIIMGHHPHVVQGIEIYKGKPIFYSLGNFIFTKSRNDLNNKTIMANVTVDKEGNIIDINIIPGNINNGKPTPMEGAEKDSFIKHLNKMNVNYVVN
jgi:poly-gamma-glutamate synthesis protein (capsule biosynthesis protein)